MFPVANSIIAISVVIGLLIGAMVGALSGLVFSWLFRLKRYALWKDALLGVLGYSIGWVLYFLLLRWSEHIPSPVLMSFGLGILFPAIREMYRLSASRALADKAERGI